MNVEQIVNSYESWSMPALAVITFIAIVVALIDFFQKNRIEQWSNYHYFLSWK